MNKVFFSFYRYIFTVAYAIPTPAHKSNMAINILLADDHSIIMDGLKSLIAGSVPEACIAQVSDMDAVLAHLVHTETQLVVCDINMPGANHFGIVKMIKSVQPQTKLLILSAYNPELYAHRYLQEGADAYLSKNAPTSEIRDTIRGLLYNTYDAESIQSSGHTIAVSPLKALSNRELEVAQLLITGNGILEIANLLQVHVNTVSTYKTRIFEKINIASIPELITVFRNYAN
ncbi:response regulator [Chitinophagaceae bacterium MMS25-I14]